MDNLLIGPDTQCSHGAYKGYCLEHDCPGNWSAEDCDICGGIHTAAFIAQNLDCRADYPPHTKVDFTAELWRS